MADLGTTYREIAEYIQAKDGQCVLILGPELSVGRDGTGYKSHFRKLASDANNGIFAYFEKENLFSFENETALKSTRRLVKDFYKDSGDPRLIEMIARIKFPLIINVCPDATLNKAYDDRNIEYSSGYFSKDSKAKFKDLPYPTKKNPVIYNIFGSVESDISLILNHSKLYETIEFLLPKNSLPDNIEVFLDQASSFILLGLKFDSWYYQLLCHKLKLKEYNKSKTNLSASNSEGMDSVSVVMRKYFEIDFTADNPVQAVERILDECKDNPQAVRGKEFLESYGLFVSYAWRDQVASVNNANRETVVDWIERYSAIKEEKLLRLFRDHNDLTYGDSIDSFMTRIGKGKSVIRIISDKYLKSRYCMTEAIRIEQYSDDEKRIFTIIWEDADINNDIHYRDYWKNKCQSILDDLEKKLDNDGYDHSVQIYRFMNGFLNRLKDQISLRIGAADFIVNEETGNIEIREERKADFNRFIEVITQKMKEN